MKRGIIKKLTIVSFFILSLFIFTKHSLAAEINYPPLSFSEIYYNALGDDLKEEWIEIYNTSDDPINLENYSLVYKTSSPFNLSGTLEPKETFIIARNETTFFELNGFKPNISGLSFTMSNTSGDLSIKNDEEIVDSVIWDSENFLVDPGHSIERHFSETVDFDFYDQPDPSPGQLYEPKTYSKKVQISELYPRPTEGYALEFIELYNSGNIAVDLSGWKINDLTKSFSIPKDTIILKYSYLSFGNKQTGISLNDSKEEISLLDPNNEKVHTISYSNAPKGSSYAFFQSVWKWTILPTSGKTNVYQIEEEPENEEVEDGENKEDEEEFIQLSEVNIAQLKQGKVGQEVLTSGIVTVPPASLSDSYFYIEDSSGGVQIYCSKKDFPALTIGDLIKVTGVISQSNGEFRIKITDRSSILIISKSEPPPPKPPDQSPDNVGRVVVMQGQVTQANGNTFYVSSGDDDIKIIVRNNDLVQKPKLHKGDSVEVRGILSIYKDEFRILPFSHGAVRIISASLPRTGSVSVLYLLPSILFILWKLSLKTRKKHKISLIKSQILLNRAMCMRLLEI